MREQIWARRAPAAGPVVLDIDATLVEVHSEHKAGAAAHYKGGYGFHPLLCFSDDGDALGAVLRPGNAAANSIDDHIALPRRGDRAAARGGRGRAAGCSTKIAEAARVRNVGFSLVARRNDAIDSAIAAVPVTDKCWQRAIRQSGDVRPGAAVADLTDCVDTADWPKGTRLIVRREPRHPGAQRSLFGSDDWRYWGHWTDQEGPAAERDAHMRAPRRRRGPHRRPQNRRPHTPALQGLQRQRRLGRPRVLGAHPRRVVPTTRLRHRHPRQSRRQTPPLDPLAHPPDASPARGAERPSACPPTTPAQRTSPASTTTSPPSPKHPTKGHKTPQPPPL